MIDFPRGRETRSQDFNYIQVKLASPEEIRSWSFGEVTKPETINYRSFKPERDGLFCERIFGPVKDWECHCGKFKRIRFRGHVCDKCGVEVTLSKVRRERMGHIELAVPVAHIWMFKTLPSQMGYLLGMTLRDLEKVIYYAAYVVTAPGAQDVKHSQVIDEDEFLALREKAREEGDTEFKADIGADAVRNLLRQIDVESLAETLREQVAGETSQHRKKMVLKRLKVIDAIRNSGDTASERNKPEWMIMDVVPVIPPDLRPLVPLDGGRFATSDLNDLYRRVINRNNRLKKLMEMRAPEVILRNEKRMLQEAVDALFDNGRRSKAIRGRGKRPLKSLSDMLKGKQGRFRQNLLGKRVDYSGRSVIVVGPELKLHQCGLPKAMAVELFKPFIIHELEKRGEAETVKRAKKIVERDDPRVYEVLEDIIRDHPVLLNRAPTLHRLGIQAFEPVLVEGKAIRIHPLVCAAFNADFDGDQMAVHVPLSFEAQLEARVLMLSSNNILLPSNGRPIAAPSQDIVIGCYWLTHQTAQHDATFEADLLEQRKPGSEADLSKVVRRFGNVAEVEMALAHKAVGYHSPIYYFTDPRPENELEEGEERKAGWIRTTPGRVIFNSVVPAELGYWNRTMGKKELGDIIFTAYRQVGLAKTVVFLDDLKAFGFRYSTLGGVSVGIEDMEIPAEKDQILREADEDVTRFTRAYNNGVISNGERYNKVIDTWTHANNDVADAMVDRLRRSRGGFNPVYMMMNSGARGSRDQMRQLAGMRGLMAKPQKKLTGGIGEIIESPIKSNFREGLTVLEYFISTHGARKGLADTALKTADAGYLTRRLVDVAQDVTITEDDCGTILGLEVSALKEGEDVVEPLKDRIVGSVAADDVFDPIDGEILVEAGQLINEEIADDIEDAGIQSVKIRSVLTCESRRGLCVKCYGRNLATMGIVDPGEAVGILAAQSIGEPGTQLTLRTFHIGGTAARIAATTVRKSKVDGVAQFDRVTTVSTPDGTRIVTSREGEIIMRTAEGAVRSRLAVPYGATISVHDGDTIAIGDTLFSWDPYSEPIVADFGGTVRFIDIIDEATVREELDESTGRRQMVIIEDRSKKLHPMIEIVDPNSVKLREFIVPVGAQLTVRDGEAIEPGATLAKIAREAYKTRDITGGLPRIAELFEARRPKDPAVITEVDGTVRFGDIKRGKREVIVIPDAGNERVYEVPVGKHLRVHEGDFVRAGDRLSEGPVNPHDILRIKGPAAVQQYLLNEVQEVYRLQGVKINDKHIGVIIRQMLQKVRIMDPGDTEFLEGETIDRTVFLDTNQEALNGGRKPATSEPLLLGITKASLTTQSFISAASFQETTRVLTDAAIRGARDNLQGLKENIIIGHLIPAGTGIYRYNEVEFGPETPEGAEESDDGGFAPAASARPAPEIAAADEATVIPA
ncbi:DNA-directed RNA polymerase subunit beta' [Longimicrobium sp.]|uniref:DNA-directed RNA polymerase subunit beta' n=1 Tax=Longimicrobium sp. TaxID=2029185 RepID=UPI002BA38E62|nr:DNA-directed RNA polymerase subunit beta' [Longimicrobium sp.]HSU14007.1 DNA-directed RNA polymerase subunit beta' [Longimicrobium sp.]